MERMPRSWAFDSAKRQPSDRGPPQWAPNSCLPESSMDDGIIFSSLKWHIGEGNLVVVGYILYYVFCKLILQVDHLSSMAKKELVWEPQQALLTMFAKRKPCGSSGIIDSFPQILAVLQQPMLAKLITGPSPSMDIA